MFIILSMDYYNKYKQYKQYKDNKFLRLVGLNKNKFEIIVTEFLDYVKLNTNKDWSPRGKKASFNLVDKLLLTMRYLRDYPTFIVLGLEFGISESYANKIFNKVSKTLPKLASLKLPSLNNLDEKVLQRVIIDVSEQRTERPKKTKFKN